MSQENVELVREMYETYLGGDPERALQYFHPQVHVDFTIRGDAPVRRGREALDEVVRTWVGTWDDYSEQIEEVLDLGDTICLVATQRGRGKGSGVEIENRFAQLYEVEDGRITSLTMYMDPATALEAARASD
jgi:ketosteroid isomerase-like protein